MERPKKFARLFKEARKEKGLTYRAVSKLTQASPTVLVQYEKGQSLPSTPILEKLCQVFGWDFKSTFVLVQDERNPDKTLTKHFRFAEPQYPEIRRILFELYNAKIIFHHNPKDTFSKNVAAKVLESLKFATKEEIANELEKYPHHFAETTLLMLAYNATYNRHATQQGAIEFYKNLENTERELQLRSAISLWAYDISQHTLLVRTRTLDSTGHAHFTSRIYSLNFMPVEDQKILDVADQTTETTEEKQT